jgi:glycosyltransferase involved in cell wall biosynthesis
MKTAFLLGIKNRILIQHDVQKLSFIPNLSKKYIALPLSKKIIANSNATKKFLIDNWKVSESKTKVIYNGINTEEFIKINLPKFKNVSIGIIGRLEPVKGHTFLLKALKILKDSHNFEPDVYIAGTGRLENQLISYVTNNSLKKIHFLGRVNSPEFLKKIDILVVPSLHEGFCLAALEGLFAGRIVIASDIDAIKEFIDDNQNGLLFSKGDTKALSNNLYRVLTEDKFADGLRNKTKKWAEKNKEKFDLSSVAKNYETLFDSLGD